VLKNSSENFNNVKEMLSEKKSVFGLVLTSPATAFAEMVGLSGYDFAWIDMEHTSLSFKDVEQLIIALENTGCVPLVRIRSNNLNSLGQVLDMGARIVSVPHVDTVDDALLAIKGAKYYPVGRRGYATFTRSNLHGFLKLDTKLMEIKNNETMLMVLIESEEAVRNAEDIANTEGVDILFVGFADLCQDMGIDVDLKHPECDRAIRTIGTAVQKSGKIGSIIVPDPQDITYYQELGFNLILCGLDSMIMKNGATAIIKNYRDHMNL